ncbi:unnamed protein product [Medioppia subpectinata]|uniref:Cell cycle checkpoint protein RAD17 n=1 Tax=Medioppia subpectinata TaxID=1979941 RepID=A0A7R9KKI2_9ACAR|nr:unnamed protein product [Medioppia subpectinata]CAG2105279.1 unnamed protein product [Medioppia subpectinata]
MSKSVSNKWSDVWIKPSFDTSMAPKAKKRQFSEDTAEDTTTTTPDSQSADPLDSLVANDSKELAISSAKCKQLSQWFSNHFRHDSNGSKFLLLNGPTGTGKTTSLQVLAKEFSVEVIEYKTYSQWFDTVLDEEMNERRENVLKLENQIQDFKHFIDVSVRYAGSRLSFDDQTGAPVTSAPNGSRNRLILIEEFPNAFYLKPEALHKELRFYSKHFGHRLIPIVFIISETTNGHSDEYKLLPKALQMELQMSVISFKPITDNSLHKVIKKFTDNKLSRNEMQKLVDSSSGDVRNAVNNIQLVYRHLNTGNNKCDKKSRKIPKVDTMDSMCDHILRDPSLTITHAVGKVLYAKRQSDIQSNQSSNVSTSDVRVDSDYELPPHLSAFRRIPLMDSPQSIADKIVVSSDTFNGWLHQNYVDFCDSLESAQNCIQWLSQSDAFFTGEHHFNEKSVFESYQSSLAIGGLMFHLPASNRQMSDAEVMSDGRERRPPKRTFKPFDKPQTQAVNRWADSMKRQISETVCKCDPFSRVNSIVLDLMPFLSQMPQHLRLKDEYFKYLLSKIVSFDGNCDDKQFNERELCLAFSHSSVNRESESTNHTIIKTQITDKNENNCNFDANDEEDYTIEDSDCD